MKTLLTLIVFALSASAYGQTVGIDGKTMYTAPYWQNGRSIAGVTTNLAWTGSKAPLPVEFHGDAYLYPAPKETPSPTVSNTYNYFYSDRIPFEPPKLAFTQFGGGERSLLIEGATYFTGSNKYAPPAKPEEITITLWTKDGKEWKSKWEEVK